MFSITSDIDFFRYSLLSSSDTSKSNTAHFTVNFSRFFHKKAFALRCLIEAGLHFQSCYNLALLHILVVYLFHLLLISLLQMKTHKLNQLLKNKLPKWLKIVCRKQNTFIDILYIYIYTYIYMYI